MYQLYPSGRFNRDIKKIRGNKVFSEQKMLAVLDSLALGNGLDPIFRDHKLFGKFRGCREFHLAPDILLIYRINQSRRLIELVRIGSHSELFG